MPTVDGSRDGLRAFLARQTGEAGSLIPPPAAPTVDVAGYQPPPAALGGLTDDEAAVRIRRALAAAPADVTVKHKDPIRGTVWHPPGAACEACDELLDLDP